MAFTIEANFIGNFKLGDNICHNFKVLSALYEAMGKTEYQEDEELFYKPIIVWIGSIAEALLHDLHFRIQSHTIEGVRTISKDLQKQIKEKIIDDQGKFIASARKNDLFKVTKNPSLYDKMDELRKLRNRVHIQNLKNDFERNDSEAFTKARVIVAEKILEKMVKTLATHYGRAKHRRHGGDLSFPWDEHFKPNSPSSDEGPSSAG